MPRRKRKKHTARKIEKPVKIKSTAAFILLLIAEIILFANAFLMFFFNSWIIFSLNQLKSAGQFVIFGKAIEFTVPTTAQLIQTGIVLLLLCLLTIFSYYRISRGQKYGPGF